MDIVGIIVSPVPNDRAHLPLWSASGIAVRCSALLGKPIITYAEIARRRKSPK